MSLVSETPVVQANVTRDVSPRRTLAKARFLAVLQNEGLFAG